MQKLTLTEIEKLIYPVGFYKNKAKALKKLPDVILEKFNGGPVGLKNLAASLGEELSTLEEIYEPYLIQSDFLERTPRGRKLTRKGLEYLGYQRGMF